MRLVLGTESTSSSANSPLLGKVKHFSRDHDSESELYEYDSQRGERT